MRSCGTCLKMLAMWYQKSYTVTHFTFRYQRLCSTTSLEFVAICIKLQEILTSTHAHFDYIIIIITLKLLRIVYYFQTSCNGKTSDRSITVSSQAYTAALELQYSIVHGRSVLITQATTEGYTGWFDDLHRLVHNRISIRFAISIHIRFGICSNLWYTQHHWLRCAQKRRPLVDVLYLCAFRLLSTFRVV